MHFAPVCSRSGPLRMEVFCRMDNSAGRRESDRERPGNNGNENDQEKAAGYTKQLDRWWEGWASGYRRVLPCKLRRTSRQTRVVERPRVLSCCVSLRGGRWCCYSLHRAALVQLSFAHGGTRAVAQSGWASERAGKRAGKREAEREGTGRNGKKRSGMRKGGRTRGTARCSRGVLGGRGRSRGLDGLPRRE